MTQSRRLVLEFFLLFIALPAALALLKPRGWIYPLLWVIAALCCHTLYRRYHYDLRADWNMRALTRPAFQSMARLFLPLALALFLFTWFSVPERLFAFPLERPGRWAFVMIWYPVLSVLPQEMIFRAYFFRRYAPLFPAPGAMVLASAVAFGWAHVMLTNWVAVVFSAAGGYLFALTYRRTNSLAAAWAEHAIYGCWVFTLGLGYYFYHGSAVR